MNQQEMADVLEIQQLAARYMMLSARKDNDHWLDVFTPDGVYNAFGTAYGLEISRCCCRAPRPGSTSASLRLSSSTATPRPAYSTTSSSTRPPTTCASPGTRTSTCAPPTAGASVNAADHVHAPQRHLRPRQRARPGALVVAGQRSAVVGDHAHRHHGRAGDPQLRDEGRPDGRRRPRADDARASPPRGSRSSRRTSTP